MERAFRYDYARLVATLARRVGIRHIDNIEDAMQSALMAALAGGCGGDSGESGEPSPVATLAEAEATPRLPAAACQLHGGCGRQGA